MGTWGIRLFTAGSRAAFIAAVLTFALTGSRASAASKRGNGNANENSFQAVLERDSSPGSPEQIVLAAAIGFLSDREAEALASNRGFPIGGREAEVDQVLDALVRIKPGVPVLLGAAGSGKTSVVIRAVQKIVQRQFPHFGAHEAVLSNSVWIETTIDRLGDPNTIDRLVPAVRELETKYKRRFVFVLENINELHIHQIRALQRYLGSASNPLLLVGTATSEKFHLAFKNETTFLQRIQTVPVPDMTPEQVSQILTTSWEKEIEHRYGVILFPEAVDAAIRLAPRHYSEMGLLDGSIKLLQDLAIDAVRQDQYRYEKQKAARADSPVSDLITTEEVPTLMLSEREVYEFTARRAGYPVNPYDPVATEAFFERLKKKINTEIFGQPRMVNDVLELVKELMTGTSKKGLAVSLALGPSGTGKTELGKLIAKLVFGNENAFLRIDANEYKTGGHSLMKLFGPESGLIKSDSEPGVLPAYFDDPARGKFRGLILIDEAERAHPDFWERLMEFFDTGTFVGGDGKRRFAQQHMVLMTSNRGEQLLFPAEEMLELLTPAEANARVAKITSDQLIELIKRKITGRDTLEIPGPILNRIDTLTVSRPLTRADAVEIAQKQIRDFIQETAETYGVQLVAPPEFAEALTPLAPGRNTGARPFIRRTRRTLEKLRQEAFATGRIKRGATVTFVLDRGPQQTRIARLGSASVTLVQPRPNDPLADPANRTRLANLESVLKSHLVGQDEMLADITRSTQAYYGSPQKRSHPLAFLAVGPTGTGKTMLGRALADALFGSPELAQILSFGGITSIEKLNRLFGSDPGYLGSNQEQAFEKALMSGAKVIVLDEVSNAGGGNREVKEAILKTLYEIFGEGVWTSSATGKTYDLRDTVFVLTGNDGDHLFNGLLADDLRIATWEDHRKKVKEILRSSGFPEPLLARMAGTYLAKPLLRSEVRQIAHAKLQALSQPYVDLGYRVTAHQDFEDRLAQVFFSTQYGARSLRAVTEEKIGGAITQARLLVPAEFDASQLDIRLSLRETTPPRAFLKKGEADAQVFLKVEFRHVVTDEVIVSHESDLTSDASFPKRLPVREAIRTAYHEAGHAIVNDPVLTGQKLRHLTILGEREILGYAHYDTLPESKYRSPDRDWVVARIAMLFAGQAATVMAGFDPDAGWSNDVMRARQVATQYAQDWALASGLVAAATNSKGKAELTGAQREQLTQEIASLMEDGMKKAQEDLRAQWGLVVLTAGTLLKTGFMSGAEFEKLQKRVHNSHALSAAEPRARGIDCMDLLSTQRSKRKKK